MEKGHKLPRQRPTLRDALDDAGVTVLVIDPAIDTSTPIGRLIRNVLGSISEFERDTFLDRSMAGRRSKLARGELPRSGAVVRHARLASRCEWICCPKERRGRVAGLIASHGT
jgi:hypothetical protein